mgnify:CR=1 FL=1
MPLGRGEIRSRGSEARVCLLGKLPRTLERERSLGGAGRPNANAEKERYDERDDQIAGRTSVPMHDSSKSP